MPEYGENRKDCSAFDAMSTESLEKLLYLDSQLTGEEALDVDVILYILEVIDRRRKETPASLAPSPDVDKAWDTFRKKYALNLTQLNKQSFYEYDDEPSCKNNSHSPNDYVSKKKATSPPYTKKRRLLHVAYAAAIIAALLCIMTATASALGYDLWGAIAQWSEETFSFVPKQNTEIQRAEGVKDEAIENSYKTLQEALDDYGITEPLVPTWFPDGFEPVEVKVSDFSGPKIIFDACYQCADKTIVIAINRYGDADNIRYGTWQKDDAEISTLEIKDITFYMMKNLEDQVAIWLTGPFEVSISGNVSSEEMVAIIQSIYEGGSQ